MSLLPQISLSLGNKCNTVTIEELTGLFVTDTNIGGWGGPNIDTSVITYAAVNVFPYTGSVISASGTGEITGTLFSRAKRMFSTAESGVLKLIATSTVVIS